MNLHTVLWSKPAMMTGIWGLRHQEEHRARDNVKTSKPSLLVHMPSISGLTTGKETQHEVHSHQQNQPCNTNVAVHLDQTGREAEHPGPNDASQGFPERELPRFRKEASILRTETFGSHSSKARANDPPHENVWAKKIPHILPKGSVNHGQAATG